MEYQIHPTAVVAEGAKLAQGVHIGPYAVIGPEVVLAEGVKIHSHAIVDGWTELGPRCQVFPGAQVGGIPQDMKFKECRSYVKVGEGSVIRECATVHRSAQEDGVTRIGKHCFLMAYTHIAHDCQLGDYVIIANYTGLAGHVTIEDFSVLSGMVAVHQFVRIGRLSMTSAGSMVGKDLPPYFISQGYPAVPMGVNVIGLRRRGFTAGVREDIKRAFMLLYRSDLNTKEALERIRETIPVGEELTHLINFVETSKRGISKSRRSARQGAEELEELEVM